MNNIDRTEWLKNRTTGIGGSDSSVILGINPWKSKLELWTEKVTGNIVENNTPDLYWGKKLEPFILEEYVEKTKRNVKAGMYEYENIVSKEYPFMRANLDGVIEDKERGKGVLEMKTKGAYIKWNEAVPDYYYSQIQHYLCVTGFSWASFAVLDFGKKDLFWCDIEKDEKFIKKLIEEESKFWKLVQDKVPPEVDNSKACESFLKEKYSKEEPEKEIDLTDNDEASDWALILKLTREQIEPLKEKELLCKNNLMNIIGNAEVAIGKGFKITWRSPKDKNIFDEERFKENYLNLYNEFIKSESQSRRFTIKFKE